MCEEKHFKVEKVCTKLYKTKQVA